MGDKTQDKDNERCLWRSFQAAVPLTGSGIVPILTCGAHAASPGTGPEDPGPKWRELVCRKV